MVNPINVNTQGIGNSYGYGIKPKAEEKKEADDTQNAANGNQKTPVNADAVLNYMAQSAVSVTPSSASSVDTSKYVDSESAARIAGFMSNFEDIVATNLAAISKEFPNMTDNAKQALALAQVNAQA